MKERIYLGSFLLVLCLHGVGLYWVAQMGAPPTSVMAKRKIDVQTICVASPATLSTPKSVTPLQEPPKAEASPRKKTGSAQAERTPTRKKEETIKTEPNPDKGKSLKREALQKAREQLKQGNTRRLESQIGEGVAFSVPQAPVGKGREGLAEEGYRGGLVSQLQMLLRLPDDEEVQLRLTLLRSGHVKEVFIVASKSDENRRIIEEKLQKMHFPPFGKDFPGEEEHTFQLLLSTT